MVYMIRRWGIALTCNSSSLSQGANNLKQASKQGMKTCQGRSWEEKGYRREEHETARYEGYLLLAKFYFFQSVAGIPSAGGKEVSKGRVGSKSQL